MIININDFYPNVNESGDVPQEVVEFLIENKRRELAYIKKKYYHKAQYSLDVGDQIESEILNEVLSVEKAFELSLTNKSLYQALQTLPNKQRNRIYAHYVLQMSKSEISKLEKVNKSQITRSIDAALLRLKKYFEKNKI